MRFAVMATCFIVAYTCSCCLVYTEDLLLPAQPSDAAAGSGDAGTTGRDAGSATVLYSTSFEPGQPLFALVDGSGELTATPPAGTTPHTGERVLSSTVLSSAFEDRDIRSECVSLGGSEAVAVDAWAMASPQNGPNEIRGRLALLWFAGLSCEVPLLPAVPGVEVPLPQGNYELIPLDAEPPGNAGALQVRLDMRDGGGVIKSWAADDVEVRQ